jgi:hypothetical protein
MKSFYSSNKKKLDEKDKIIQDYIKIIGNGYVL